jgi:hypothetical protein
MFVKKKRTMVTKENFIELYDQYLKWQKSQAGQTDGYEYERSFETFVQQMNKDLFKMATELPVEDKTKSVRSKKKSRRNTVK